MPFQIYEPFGPGRFATDHSLTKAASRPLFARVRRYARQSALKISYLKSACLITHLVVGINLIRLFLKFVYFMSTTTTNIHMRNF